MNTICEGLYGMMLYPIANANASINSYLSTFSPTTIILITVASTYALKKFAECWKLRWGESPREKLGRLALSIPCAKSLYDADTSKEFTKAQESVRKQWAAFQPLQTTLPKIGWKTKEISSLLEQYAEKTVENLQSKHLSGAIYSNSLTKDHHVESLSMKTDEQIDVDDEDSNMNFLSSLSPKLSLLYTQAFKLSHLWNSLHSEEFPIGPCIDHQVVRMVAGMFGGNDNSSGFVTSGGTESLMLAMRIYRNWGFTQRGHDVGEGIIIACSSVHAAIEKACQAYLINVVYIGCDHSGRADLDELQNALKKYGSKVIGIVGSAPSYARGVIDPIEKMAALAVQYGCPMHVDCCLGGFIVNYLEQHNSDYLKLQGVTSLSADTHKNGLAPKGASVLVTKELGGVDLASFGTYVVPGWSGGVYGTPKDAGSQPCVYSLCSLVALLTMGSQGYLNIAKAVHHKTCELAKIIKQQSGKLRLLAEPEVNVVSFAIDPEWRLQDNAIYVLADELYKRKIVLNKLQGQEVHFCVTLRFAANPEALQEFQNALTESIIAVEDLNQEIVAKGERFSGSAGMYCALNAALKPNKKGAYD